LFAPARASRFHQEDSSFAASGLPSPTATPTATPTPIGGGGGQHQIPDGSPASRTVFIVLLAAAGALILRRLMV
jgi:hypothetical protein